MGAQPGTRIKIIIEDFSLKSSIFAIWTVFHVRTDTGHHYDKKSSYVETVQLIGNAPGGANTRRAGAPPPPVLVSKLGGGSEGWPGGTVMWGHFQIRSVYC